MIVANLLVAFFVLDRSTKPTTNAGEVIPSYPHSHSHHDDDEDERPRRVVVSAPRGGKNDERIERRGGGLLTTHTACRISAWHYHPIVDRHLREGKKSRKRSRGRNNGNVCDALRTVGQRLGHRLANASKISGYDTIYVPFPAMERFVRDMLPNIAVEVIIISGHPFNVRPMSNDDVRTLLDNPRIVAWFCQNLSKYGGSNPHHTKVHPFPYGLNEKMNKLGLSIYPAYKDVLFDGLEDDNATTMKITTTNGDGDDVNATFATTYATTANTTATPPKNDDDVDDRPTFVYAGPLKKVERRRRSSSDVGGGREYVPGSDVDRLPPREYFVAMSRSRYVLSPNGDRPECHRHYEAIGLGTGPIPELDVVVHRHLKDGPVIYSNVEWNVTELERVLDPRPIVNRNLIREDYWMGWMEDVVGHRLNWNDRLDGGEGKGDDDGEGDGDGDGVEDEDEDDQGDGDGDRVRKNNGLTDMENRLLDLLGGLRGREVAP